MTGGHASAAAAAGDAGAGAASKGTFLGNLDNALEKIFAGEGGEAGAGLTPMWPSVTAPALTGPEIEKVVKGNTLTMTWHYDYHFAADGSLAGTNTTFKKLGDASKCPAKIVEGDGYSLSSDKRSCWKTTVVPTAGAWSVKNHQLCLDIRWTGGVKQACQYVAILLDDIALFDVTGTIDGKGMKLVKGKQLTKLSS
jgi:hypothetical protein